MNSIYDVIEAAVKERIEDHSCKSIHTSYQIGLIGDGPVNHLVPPGFYGTLTTHTQERLKGLQSQGLPLDTLVLEENEGFGVAQIIFDKGYSAIESLQYFLSERDGEWEIDNVDVTPGVISSHPSRIL
jgi:hypothetical protein